MEQDEALQHDRHSRHSDKDDEAIVYVDDAGAVSVRLSRFVEMASFDRALDSTSELRMTLSRKRTPGQIDPA